MATLSEKVKAALAALEAAGKALNAVDEDCAKAEAVRALLAARSAELGDVDARTVRANEAFAAADADHARWREVSAREQAAGNARIDKLQGQLRALEDQVAQRRKEHDNIIAGIAALTQRLRVG